MHFRPPVGIQRCGKIHPSNSSAESWTRIGVVAGSVAGEELAHPKFHPFWAKCEALGVLVFLHPLGTRELEASGRLAGSGLLTNTIGNPLETTIALSHLIFEGTLDRFSGLKICAAHRPTSCCLLTGDKCGIIVVHHATRCA